MRQFLNTKVIHPSWRDILNKAMQELNPEYLLALQEQSNWLPGHTQVFNAFTLPLDKVRYILFGESPYPRAESANGYAFWDARVDEIWSKNGLSTKVNRATSLRNIIKMLLLAAGDLDPENTYQPAIADINKNHYVTTLNELFQNIQAQGILLLNATLVYRQNNVQKDAKAWRPFISKLLELIADIRPDIELILFGKVAEAINSLPQGKQLKRFYAEHPFNHSFIVNQAALDFFRPLHLLEKNMKGVI